MLDSRFIRHSASIIRVGNEQLFQYQVVNDINARDAIPSGVRFEGMSTFVLSSNILAYTWCTPKV